MIFEEKRESGARAERLPQRKAADITITRPSESLVNGLGPSGNEIIPLSHRYSSVRRFERLFT